MHIGQTGETTGEVIYRNIDPMKSGKPHYVRVKAVTEYDEKVIVLRQVDVG